MVFCNNAKNSLSVGNFYIFGTQNALFLAFITFENDLIIDLSVFSTRIKILEKRKCVSGDHPIGPLPQISEHRVILGHSLSDFFKNEKMNQ